MQNPVSLLKYKSTKKLSLIMQTEVAECGLASIAMVANYYDHNFDLNYLRQKYTISSKGTTLDGLIKLADLLQFSSRPLKLELNDLSKLKTPAILHWDLNHFVVLKKVKKNSVVIHDPAVGVKEYSMQEFSKHFTGIALELTPTPDFKPVSAVKKAKLSDFWNRITGFKRVLVQILILSLLLQIFAVATPFYMQIVVDDVIISQDLDLLVILAIGFGMLIIINIMVTTLRGIVILYMGTQLNIQIAANLFRHLMKLPMDYFNKRHIGGIISRFGSLDSIKQLLTTGLIEAVVDGIMAVGLLIMMLIYSPKLAFLVLTSVILYILFRLFSYNRFQQLNKELIVTGAKENSNFIESVRAIQSIKLFSNESQRQIVWQNFYADTMNASIKVGKLNIRYNLINSLIFGIENVLVVYFAAIQVMDSLISIGMLLAFLAYKTQFTSKASSLIEKLIQFKMISLHMERLGDIVLSKPEQDINGTRLLPEINGAISLNKINFKYSDNEPYILKDLCLDVKQGSSIAIVGASGCGKTTLLKVMLGLLQPLSGQVKVDGCDIRQIGLKPYRHLIGTVMQDDQLLSGSIADNICFFEPDFDNEQIEECAKMAAIHLDVVEMPMGYHTLIGDMGSSLSGGQKQRILLARALYKKPKILFLDEATSSLDIVLEQKINETVKNLNITRIIIAHRPETIAMAEKIVILHDGKITIPDLTK